MAPSPAGGAVGSRPEVVTQGACGTLALGVGDGSLGKVALLRARQLVME